MKTITPKRKVKISLNIDSEALRRLDKLCATKNLSRPQVIEMIFSTDDETVTFMTEQIKKIDSAIGF
ncbi:MAG TPA: ribbon-helix-helix protein, CopG family [Desulfosporosinus sp.]